MKSPQTINLRSGHVASSLSRKPSKETEILFVSDENRFGGIYATHMISFKFDILAKRISVDEGAVCVETMTEGKQLLTHKHTPPPVLPILSIL